MALKLYLITCDLLNPGDYSLSIEKIARHMDLGVGTVARVLQGNRIQSALPNETDPIFAPSA